ncbi:MAG: hypothetical protein Q8R48_06370 [Candidatus Omnitrophota bacterium]|nr:hypothetical protein [Candidatus Omnitrophota bacterium]
MTINPEWNIFKSELEKISGSLNIGKNEDNSTHITYDPQIYFNVSPAQSENMSENKIKDIVKDTVANIISDPEKYGLYYNLTDKLQPKEFTNLAARAVVEASGIAIADHGRIYDYAKGEEPQIDYKKSSDEQDEMAIHILRLKNIWWRRIPNRFKSLVAVSYVIAIIAIPAILVMKPFDAASTKKSEIIPKENKAVSSIMDAGLRNGGFENGFADWERRKEQSVSSASSDATVTFFSDVDISSFIRRTGQKSLCIKNANPKTGKRQIMYLQRIYGLKPDTQYELTYYIKGSLKSKDALWFHLGDDWRAEGKRYYSTPNENYTDWTKQSATVTTGDYNEANFWLISEDVCDLYLDDITFTEITKQQPSASKQTS